jgi:hypothetical protein
MTSRCERPSYPGLPDGLFSNQKSQFGYIVEGLEMENVLIFYNHLKFMVIWYNLWQFDIVCGHLVYFSHFGMFGPRKIWQPCSYREATLAELMRMLIKYSLKCVALFEQAGEKVLACR